METWAIVVLVVGTNLGTALLALLGIKKQLKYSDKRFGKELEAKREADEHNRKWVVRSRPLLELSTELAHMAEKLGAAVDYAIQIVEGVTPYADGTRKNLEQAVKEWSDYIESGEFYKALHVQYDHKLKIEAHDILLKYQSAYTDLMPFLHGGKADEKTRKGRVAMKENAAKVSAMQLKIYKMLEKL